MKKLGIFWLAVLLAVTCIGCGEPNPSPAQPDGSGNVDGNTVQSTGDGTTTDGSGTQTQSQPSDPAGTVEVTVEAEDIRYYNTTGKYSFFFATRGGKIGAIDVTGKTVIPFKYTDDYLYFLPGGASQVNFYGKYEHGAKPDGTVEDYEQGAGWGPGCWYRAYWDADQEQAILAESCWGTVTLLEFTKKQYWTTHFCSAYQNAPLEQMDVILLQKGSMTYQDKQGDEYLEASFDIGGKYALYNITTGKLLSDFVYDDWCDGVGGLIPVKQNGKWKYITASGTTVIDNCAVSFQQYDIVQMYGVCNGFLVVKRAAGYSLYLPNGELALPDTYEDMTQVSPQGYCFVKQNGKWKSLKVK